MPHEYQGISTRFLREDERLITSAEKTLPLVLEAKDSVELGFLQQILSTHSTALMEDLAHYGAILLRGFAVQTDEDFEKTILSIQGISGIREAFMAEVGRVHVDPLQYVLYTNAIYKTGGTAYLGGFHSENYYSTDVPTYLFFCCHQPSKRGGETGLIHAEHIFSNLPIYLQHKLEQQPFFVAKWLVSEVAECYQISCLQVEQIVTQFGLTIIGEGKERFILMYKPSVLMDPQSQKKSLHINLFEIAQLNEELRLCFQADYSGKAWLWHRAVWKLPKVILSGLEYLYLAGANLIYSPKNALKVFRANILANKAWRKQTKHQPIDLSRVGSCFTPEETKTLAQLIRRHYSSCLWQKGDILLVDNRKIMHAGMPGYGPRLVRAMIANPVDLPYSSQGSGLTLSAERQEETLGQLIRDSAIKENYV